MITKSINQISTILLGLAVLLGMATLTTVPASGAENGGSAVNVSGSLVQIACVFGQGPYYTMKEGSADSTRFCPNDTDQARTLNDGRCVFYGGINWGPLDASTWYFAKPNKWYKIPGLGRMAFHAYTPSRCKTTKEYPLTQ